MNASPDHSSQRPITRRLALLTALASGPLACQRGRQPGTTAASAAGAGASGDGAGAYGGLSIASAGPMKEGERGGTAVVLLHGWGAPGDDLVPLGTVLARPGVRFYMPAAPLPERGGGRAWWHLDEVRPPHAWEDELPAGHSPHPEVVKARQAVQGVLRTIVERQAPQTLMLAGFSQGAMLALDVALAGEPKVDRVAGLSGLLLADSLPALRAAPASGQPRPPVFLAHGQYDQVVPYPAGERARALLEKHGLTVTWRPFPGGHEIPPEVVKQLSSFLFAGS